MSGERDALMESEKTSNATDFTKNNEQLSDNEEKEEETYAVDGGKLSFHGVVYQLRLLIFFILKCLANNYSFSIATEMKDAGKFDDVILRRKKSPLGGFSYRLIQAKHKGASTSKNINYRALLSEKLKGAFNLMMYFKSYLELRPIFTSGQDEIRDLIICTNGKFESDDPFGSLTFGISFDEIDDEDKIFPMKLLRFSAEGRRITKDYLKTPIEGIVTQSEADIDCFLDKLRFAIGIFDNEDLAQENKILFQRAWGISKTEHAYSTFENEINDWMMSDKGKYFSDKNARTSFQRLRNKFGKMIFGFRDPIWNFVGRQHELEKMDEILKNISKKIIVISGLGGMGKSELARRFIHNNSSVFQRIVWITGDCESSLINEFEELAKKLEIDVKDKKINTIIEEIYGYFSRRDSIFVFDNVDRSDNFTEQNHYVKNFLPNNSNCPFLILTSRLQWNWENVGNIMLKQFNQDDAEKFIREYLHYECHSSEDAIKKLAQELQNFPLALQQAVAFINNKCKDSNLCSKTYSIDNYLKTFEEKAEQVLNSKMLDSSAPVYKYTTMTTWTMTFSAIEDQDKKAAMILNIISHFTPDNINTRNIFLYFDRINEEDVIESLNILKEFSVIEFIDNKIQIHRLVQKVILLKLKEKGEYETTLRLVLKPIFAMDVEQKISVWERLDGHKKIQQEYSYLPVDIVFSLSRSFRYEQEYICGRTLVNVLKEICEPTDADLLLTMAEFAWVSLELMHEKEAITIFEDVIKRVIKEVCEYNTMSQATENQNNKNDVHNEDTKGSESSLKFGIPNCYLKSGNITDALNLFTVLFEKREFRKEKDTLMKNIETVFWSINWIVEWNSELGDKKKALLLHEHVYETEKLIFGENHHITLSNKFNIALRNSDIGDERRALRLLEEIHEKQKDILGENYASTWRTKLQMAMRYSELGEKRKALTLLVDMHEKIKDILGENHKMTLTTIFEIAMRYSDLGEKRRALTLLEEVHKKQKDILGENHKNTLKTKFEIAMRYSDLGEKRRALTLLEKVHEKQKDIPGENHKNTLKTKFEISMRYSDLGEKMRALTLLEEVHEKQKDILGENHKNTLTTKFEIAMRYSDLGEKRRALTLFEEIHETKKDTLGENHECTLRTKYDIAMHHSELGEKRKALILLEDVYDTTKDKFGENHSKTKAILEVFNGLKLAYKRKKHCSLF